MLVQDIWILSGIFPGEVISVEAGKLSARLPPHPYEPWIFSFALQLLAPPKLAARVYYIHGFLHINKPMPDINGFPIRDARGNIWL